MEYRIDIINMMLVFANGEVSIDKFVDKLIKLVDLSEIIKEAESLRQNNIISEDQFDLSEIIIMISKHQPNTAFGAYTIYSLVSNYLTYNGYPINQVPKYLEHYQLVLEIQPVFLYSCNSECEKFIEKQIINHMPQDISKKKQVEFCKAKIKEFFRYEKSYPKWLQNAEWPFDKTGKPMVFKSQERKKEGSFLKCNYYFYSPETGETVVVEQYD